MIIRTNVCQDERQHLSKRANAETRRVCNNAGQNNGVNAEMNITCVGYTPLRAPRAISTGFAWGMNGDCMFAGVT